jgi:hypothetical protein
MRWPYPRGSWWRAVLAVTAGFVWPIVRISQEPGSGSDGTPDECWKLGQIYYNPNDPALLVEKRFGVGYTINFGNRASWLLIGLLVLDRPRPLAPLGGAGVYACGGSPDPPLLPNPSVVPLQTPVHRNAILTYAFRRATTNPIANTSPAR